MANITPTLVITDPIPGVETHFWETVTESDTPLASKSGGLLPLVSTIQVTGTFGSASVAVQGSNDNTAWVSLKDISGSVVAITAAGGAEFSTAFKYIRPFPSGGTSQDLDIYINHRY